jgi:hypothetical protein
MSKGEALIQMLLNKAHQGDSRATKAVLELSEKIGRIETAELKLGGAEIMSSCSFREWQRPPRNGRGKSQTATKRLPSENPA